MNFVGQDAMKGSRKSWKYWIVSEMFHYHRHHAKINWRQFKIAFFQHGPADDNETCQKKNFLNKISHGSKQTAEKLNKWKSKKKFLASNVSDYFTKNLFKRNCNPCLPNPVFVG